MTDRIIREESHPHSTLCFVAANLHVVIKGNSLFPPFQFHNYDNCKLTNDSFTYNLREALTAITFDASNYAGHSFYIGAALYRCYLRYQRWVLMSCQHSIEIMMHNRCTY